MLKVKINFIANIFLIITVVSVIGYSVIIKIDIIDMLPNIIKTIATVKSIGIRATPKEVYFCIIEQKEDFNEIINIDKLILPLSLSTPNRLNFIRKTIIDIINQYNIDNAGIKVTEGNAQSLSIERISIEAIIQELFSSCTVKNYFGGNISMISRLLGIPNNGTLKKIINGEDIPVDLQFLNGFSVNQRESALAALAALNL